MKKIVTGMMLSISVMLTACGEFNAINKNSNEVLEALSPYMTEADQLKAQQLAEVYSEEILIKEDVIDNSTIEIEIEGHRGHLEVVNKNDVAFKFNGKNIYFEDLKNDSVLESLISSSLVSVDAKSASLLTLMGAKKSEAFMGSMLSSIFGLVVKGIFNYAVVKITEKVGDKVAGPISTIGNTIIDGVATGTKPNKQVIKDAKDNLIGNVLGGLINQISGGALQFPVVNQPTVQPVVQPVTQPSILPVSSTTNPLTSILQPQQNCNLFCNLFGLLMNNIMKK